MDDTRNRMPAALLESLSNAKLMSRHSSSEQQKPLDEMKDKVPIPPSLGKEERLIPELWVREAVFLDCPPWKSPGKRQFGLMIRASQNL